MGGLLVAFSKCSSSCTGDGGTKTRHRVLLQTTVLVGLSSHSLNERLQSLARQKRWGVAQVCREGAGGHRLSQASKHMRPVAQSPCSSQQGNAWSWTQTVYTSLTVTPQSLCPMVSTRRAYQGRHVPSVHLATGDLQLRLWHRTHLEVFWSSSPCPHDGWQGH